MKADRSPSSQNSMIMCMRDGVSWQSMSDTMCGWCRLRKMVISETRLSLSFLFSLFMLTDLMATDCRFSCTRTQLALDACLRVRAATYNVDATIDFGEAAFANVMQALELADNLLRACGSG